MQGLKSTKNPPYPLPVNGAVCGGLPSIMLELEPSGGGAVIARRTVYSNRGRQVLLDWPSVDAGVAALTAAQRGPGAAPYDLEIDDILMLGQELEQLTEPLYIELRSNGAGCAVPRTARQNHAERRDLASWGLLLGATQELVWAIDRAHQRSINTTGNLMGKASRTKRERRDGKEIGTGMRRVAPRSPVDLGADGVIIDPDLIWHPPSEPLDAILETLDGITRRTGHGHNTVFRDFVAFCDGVLRTLPLHLRQAALKESIVQMPPDTPDDVRQVWRDLDQRYSQHGDLAPRLFSQALWQLMQAASTCVADWLGVMFMRWKLGNGADQFFTPWNAAKLMAEMSLLEQEVHKAVMAALEDERNEAGKILRFMLPIAAAMSEAGQQEFWRTKLLPAALPYITPVNFIDPSCGSGVMLLAAASSLPPWAVRLGVVSFFGIDLDPFCALMTRVQCMLYGLNGYQANLELSLLDALEARGITLPTPEQRQAWDDTAAGAADEHAAADPPSPQRPRRRCLRRVPEGIVVVDTPSEEDIIT